MLKERAHKDVLALRFPNAPVPLGGSGVATSAPERRVGEVGQGELLTDDQAVAMLRAIGVEPTEVACREHADCWVVRYRADRNSRRP